jgi:hypothetical protein
VEDLICSCLINRLASSLKTGLGLFDIACIDCFENVTGSRTDTGLLSRILGAALRIGFDTQDRSFDIWQVIHPLDIPF